MIKPVFTSKMTQCHEKVLKNDSVSSWKTGVRQGVIVQYAQIVNTAKIVLKILQNPKMTPKMTQIILQF